MARNIGAWMKEHWRPMMAVQYFIVCLCDFAIYPVIWPLLQMKGDIHVTLMQWIPSTLGSGGMYHLAMGAVLGVAAWTRGQEKLNSNTYQAPSYIPPVINRKIESVEENENAGKNFRNEN